MRKDIKQCILPFLFLCVTHLYPGQKSRNEGTAEHLLATLKAEKEELESSLSKEKLLSLQLKQEISEAETRNTDLYKVWHVFVCLDCNLYWTTL